MKDEDQIVKTYYEADGDYRLTLFLYYPLLRNRFIDIDLNEKRMRNGIKKRKRKTFLTRISRHTGERL